MRCQFKELFLTCCGAPMKTFLEVPLCICLCNCAAVVCNQKRCHFRFRDERFLKRQLYSRKMEQ